MAAYGLDRIPDSRGYLVLTEEGAVISSGGELENDEMTATKITNMFHSACKIPITSDKKDTLKRMSVVLDSVVYVVTVSQRKIFISKRTYNPQEPIPT